MKVRSGMHFKNDVHEIRLEIMLPIIETCREAGRDRGGSIAACASLDCCITEYESRSQHQVIVDTWRSVSKQKQYSKR